MYSVPLKKQLQVCVTTYEIEESRFSSCSTSPSSSCGSLTVGTRSQRQHNMSHLSATPSVLSDSLSRSSSDRSSTASFSTGSRYADDHYPLIASITATSDRVHGTILDMAQAYNTIIRAVNSCYNHALTVEDDKIADYLFFSQTLFNVLSQQLKVDRRYLQSLLHRPVIHPRLAVRKTMSIHDDRIFEAAFYAWANYIHDSASEQFFSGEDVQSRMSTFAPILVQHLHDEVYRLNSLVNDNILMLEHLVKIWSNYEQALSGTLDLYTDAALLLGCHDRTFTINGQRAEQKFPRLPMGTNTMIRRWRSRRHEGAWRFCSSNFSGKRRVMSG